MWETIVGSRLFQARAEGGGDSHLCALSRAPRLDQLPLTEQLALQLFTSIFRRGARAHAPREGEPQHIGPHDSALRAVFARRRMLSSRLGVILALLASF